MADIHAAIRAGSDIAFLGGLVNYVLHSERWNTDPFFKEWVGHYTNAATLVSEEFKDTEDLDGVFSGLVAYRGGAPEWPLNGFVGQYDSASWQYAGPGVGDQGRVASTAQSGEVPGTKSGASQAPGGTPGPGGPPFDALVRSLLKPAPRRGETLQDPRCVLQIVKRHFSRYTPEMVERVTGCPRETFLKVAETILAGSGRDRTTSFAYAVAWTQHTNGPQIIGCARPRHGGSRRRGAGCGLHAAGGSGLPPRRPDRRCAGAPAPAPAVATVSLARPAELCRALLATLDAAEGRRKRRHRDTTPDAIGLAVKRALLEQAVRDDPEPDAFEAWLFERTLAGMAGASTGAVRAMALDVLHEWRLARAVPAFQGWLASGAPSDDAEPSARPVHFGSRQPERRAP